MKFNLFQNDVFIAGASVYKQIQGVAMGGFISAELADIYCLVHECLFYDYIIPLALHGA